MFGFVGENVTFYAAFTLGGLAKTGLTVTATIRRGATEIVSDASATEVGDGLYSYTLDASYVTAPGDYIATFVTAGSADEQQVYAAQRVFAVGIPASVTSVSPTAANVLAGVIRDGLIQRFTGETWTLTFEALPDMTNWQQVAISIKAEPEDTDTDALLLARFTSADVVAIVRVGGAAPDEAIDDLATISCGNDDAGGYIIIEIDQLVTELIEPVDGATYAVKVWFTDGTSTVVAYGRDMFEVLPRMTELEAPNPEEVPPTISAHPQNASEEIGQTAEFSVTASGGSITYQWQVSTNSGSSWANVTDGSGGTTDTYTTATITEGMDGYQYRVRCTNGYGTTTSNAATLTATGATLTGLQQYAVLVAEMDGDLTNSVPSGLTLSGTDPSFVTGPWAGTQCASYDGSDDYSVLSDVADLHRTATVCFFVQVATNDATIDRFMDSDTTGAGGMSLQINASGTTMSGTVSSGGSTSPTSVALPTTALDNGSWWFVLFRWTINDSTGAITDIKRYKAKAGDTSLATLTSSNNTFGDVPAQDVPLRIGSAIGGSFPAAIKLAKVMVFSGYAATDAVAEALWNDGDGVDWTGLGSITP